MAQNRRKTTTENIATKRRIKHKRVTAVPAEVGQASVGYKTHPTDKVLHDIGVKINFLSHFQEGEFVDDWQQRYRLMRGDWPHPDSPAGSGMSCRDYYKKERTQRAKNVIQALWFAKNNLTSAVQKETGEALDEVLDGILPALLMALVIVAGSSLVGVSLGAIGGGIIGFGAGAMPGGIAGGAVGFSAGMWILEWMGLAFLAVYIGENLHQVTWLLRQGFDEAWGRGARDWSGLSTSDRMCRPDKIPGFTEVTSASKKFAMAVAVLIRLVLESVVLYLTARGAAKLPELVAQLKNSRLGEGFAVWVENNHESLLSNQKLIQKVGGGEVKPVKTLATDVPEQTKPRSLKKEVAKNTLLTRSELEQWYKKQGERFQDSKFLESHIEGTDLSKPIIRRELEPGTEIIQYVRIGKEPGMYAAYPGASPETLAIDGSGREMVKFRVKSPIDVVETSAASYPKGKVPGVGGPGGGKQLILPTGWEKLVDKLQ